MYKLRVAIKARREIKKLEKRYQETIIVALKEIREDPSSGKPLTKELTGQLTFRVGVYRIIYKINKKDKIVFILSAGHRAVVYRK